MSDRRRRCRGWLFALHRSTPLAGQGGEPGRGHQEFSDDDVGPGPDQGDEQAGQSVPQPMQHHDREVGADNRTADELPMSPAGLKDRGAHDDRPGAVPDRRQVPMFEEGDDVRDGNNESFRG